MLEKEINDFIRVLDHTVTIQNDNYVFCICRKLTQIDTSMSKIHFTQ